MWVVQLVGDPRTFTRAPQKPVSQLLLNVSVVPLTFYLTSLLFPFSSSPLPT